MIWLTNVDEFVKQKEWYYEKFLMFYRNRVEEFYAKEYEDYPEAFPFMGPTKSITIFRDYDIISFILNSDSDSDEHISKIDGMDSVEEHDKIRSLPDHIKEKRLLDIAGIEEYVKKDFFWYGESDEPVPSYSEDVALYQGNSCADNHFNLINEKQKNDQINQFNKSVVLKRINDAQFLYELDEALGAYHAKLYLASTVTAAVALETLLKIAIVSELGVEKIPRDNKLKHTLHYATTLRNSQLIDERLFHRIQSMNELRRSGAHSKTGEIQKWDAEQMLSGINNVVMALFQERN